MSDLEAKKAQAYKVLEAIAKITGNDDYFYFGSRADKLRSNNLSPAEIDLPGSTKRVEGDLDNMYRNTRYFAELLESYGVNVTRTGGGDGRAPGFIGLIIDVEENEAMLLEALEAVATEKEKQIMKAITGAVGAETIGTRITGAVIKTARDEALAEGVPAAKLDEVTGLTTSIRGC